MSPRTAIVLTICLCLGGLIVGAGGSLPTAADEGDVSGLTEPESDVEIDSAIADTDGETTVIVQLADRPDDAVVATATENQVASMRSHANTTQTAFERFADGNPHVEIERQFWITNALAVTVDTDRVPLERLGMVENVVGIHENFEVTVQDVDRGTMVGTNAERVPSPDQSATPSITNATDETTSTTDAGYTDGLEQINVPETWANFENRGEGVTVAVLDTGVDGDHPDIEVNGWRDFSDSPSSKPIDYGDHGTHVSGTVIGGSASGTHIGVAPEADLIHGAVMTACDDTCSGSFDQMVAGMEWALEEDADVISMSLGANGYYERFIDPVQNAEEAGTIVVAASGNDGHGTSGAPGNVYESFSVGASDVGTSFWTGEYEEVADFSSGEKINTNEAWGSSAPSSWPLEYVVPDVVAPGVSVESAVPGGGYESKPGTSMATPHVSGSIALLLSNTEDDLSPAEIRDQFETTAVTLDEDPQRQGVGRIDTFEAVLDHSRETLELTITPETVTVSESTTITVAVDHPVETYDWEFADGTSETTPDPSVEHTFDELGTTAVTVTLDDGSGTATRTQEIDVVDDRPPTPTLEATQTDAIEVGVDTVEFDASASTDNHEIERYEWTIDGEPVSGNGPVIAHRFDEPGERTVTVTVVDESGNEAETSVTVEAVDTIPPTAVLELPDEPLVGEDTFDATGSTDNHKIERYEWTFGDDIRTTDGPTVDYEFAADGTYPVTLTVTDREGLRDETTDEISARAHPSLTIDGPADGVTIAENNVSITYTLADTDLVEDGDLEYRVTDTDGDQVVDWTPGPFEATQDPQQLTVHTGDLADGEYSIALRLVDDAGDPLAFEPATDERSITVKGAAPALEFDVRTDGPVSERNPAAIDVAATDPRLKSTTVTVADDGGTELVNWDVAEHDSPIEWNAMDGADAPVESGSYTVTASAVDDLGNENISSTTVDVDTDTPTISIEDVNGDDPNGALLNGSSPFTVTGDADDSVGTIANLSVVAEATFTTYRHETTVDYDADAGTWTATVNGSALPDDGKYDLTATARDAAKNENESVAGPVTVDRTSPRLSSVVTDVDAAEATVRIRSIESLRGEPMVEIETPTGTETTVADLTSESERTWTGTFDVDDAGTYELNATGIDPAGNRGADTANATLKPNQQTDNRTLTVVNERTGAFVTLNTTTDVDETFVALSETETSPAALNDGVVGLEFLTTELGDEFDAELSTATVGIPVDSSGLPENVTPDDERVALQHYDEEAEHWEHRSMTVREYADGADSIEGEYWVATVEDPATAGVTVVDDNPPELVASTPAADATLANDTGTVSVELEYADDLSGVDVSSLELAIDGERVTDDERVQLTSQTAVYEDLAVDAGETYEIALDIADRGGNDGRLETQFEVETDGAGDAGGSSGGGGGGLSFGPVDDSGPDRPEPTAAIAIDPDPAVVGEEITFSGTPSTDDEREIIRYEWVIDGTDGRGETVTTAFDEAGTYDVELTATNDFAGTNTTATTVTVVDDPDDADEGAASADENATDPNETERGDEPNPENRADDSVPGFGVLVALGTLLAVAGRLLHRTR